MTCLGVTLLVEGVIVSFPQFTVAMISCHQRDGHIYVHVPSRAWCGQPNGTLVSINLSYFWLLVCGLAVETLVALSDAPVTALTDSASTCLAGDASLTPAIVVMWHSCQSGSCVLSTSLTAFAADLSTEVNKAEALTSELRGALMGGR